jgi:ferredoxin-NADP reductase
MMIAGGSGIVPFRAMLRHRAAAGSAVATRLLYSARALRDVIYRNELLQGSADGQDEEGRAEVQIALTRTWPADWAGHRGRITPELVRATTWSAEQRPLVFVCGPTGFVETVAEALVEAGHEPSRIRTERFGPTGG